MSSIGLDKTKVSVYNDTRSKVLNLIKPSNSQINKEKEFVDSIIKKIKDLPGEHVDCLVAGSFARDTNLKDSKDFDIFVLYPPEVKTEQFVKEGLDLAKIIFKGHFSEKVYSQHPYLRGVIDGYKIEIVPAYKIDSTENLISAVDRTPFHLTYILKNIKTSQKDDVRLLKYFLKNIGCYGADSHYQAFSGYLCELLVIYYGDFLKVLEKAANWQTPVRIVLDSEDIEYLSPFNDPLVVIDPTDKKRNVASAVSLTQLSRFIAASRSFLQNPSLDFFTSKIIKEQPYHQLVSWIKSFPVILVEFEVNDLVCDIVWSKTRKLSNRLTTSLETTGFSVLKSQLYYTEGDKSAYLLVLLDTLEIPKLEKAVGPNVSDIINSQKFIENNKAIFGPFVTGDRWVAIRNRRYTDIGHISDEIIKANFDLSASVYVEEDIMNAYTKNIEIIKYFADFFYPKEKFL